MKVRIGWFAILIIIMAVCGMQIHVTDDGNGVFSLSVSFEAEE